MSDALGQLRQLVQNKRTEEAEKLVMDITKSFNELLCIRMASVHPMFDTQSGHFILSFFDSIIAILEMKDFTRTFYDEHFRSFAESIRNPILIATKVRCDPTFALAFWQRAILLVGLLTRPGTEEIMKNILENAYIMEMEVSDAGKKRKRYPLEERLEYMFQFVLKRRPTAIRFWWTLIANEVLIELYEYPIINRSGSLERHLKSRGSLTPEVQALIIGFLKNSTVRKAIEFTATSGTELLCLIHFFLAATVTEDYKECLRWFVNKWMETSMEVQNALLDIFRSCSPISLTFFLQLFVRLSVIRSKEKLDVGEFARLRHIWKKFLVPQVLPAATFAIRSECEAVMPLMLVSLFLVLSFDFKSDDPQVWVFLARRGMVFDQACIEFCQAFVETLAVTFAPLFLGFTQEDITQLVLKLKRLGSFEESMSDLYLIFAQPSQFTRYNNSNCILFELSCDGWSFEKALNYTTVLLECFPVEHRPAMYSAFVLKLSAIAKMVPRIVHKQPDFLYRYFFRKLVDVMDTDLYNIDMFRSIALSLNKTCTFHDADHDLAERWICTILRFLVEPCIDIVNIAAKPAVRAISQFSLHSFVIIPFVLMLLTDENFNIPKKWVASFLTTAYSTCLGQDYLPIPQNLFHIFDSWNQARVNKELIARARPMLTSGASSVVKKMVIADFAHRLFVLENDHAFFDMLFSAFVAVFIEELFSGEGQIPELMIELFKGFTTNGRHSSFSALDIRLVCSLGAYPDRLCAKFPAFLDVYMCFLLDLLDNAKDMESFQLLYNTLASLAVHSEISLRVFVSGIQTIKQHCTGEKKRVMNEMIETTAARFYATTPAATLRTQQDAVVIGQRFVFSFLFHENESFQLAIKTSMQCSQYLVKPLKKWNDLTDAQGGEEEDRWVPSPPSDDSGFKLMTDEMKAYLANWKGDNSSEEEEPCHTHQKEVVEAPTTDVMTSCTDSLIDLCESFGLTAHCEPPAPEVVPTGLITVDIPELAREVTPESPPVPPQTITSYLGLTSAVNTLSEHPAALSFVSILYDLLDSVVFAQCPQIIKRAVPVFELPARETIKLGVLYVSPTQTCQNEILANEESDSSPSFQAFLKSLGGVVDLGSHQWYMGKLIPEANRKSIYYSDMEYEIMFHVSTLLKSDPDDPQKILKKKHIGNDHVHIVWCENPTGYDPLTVSSQFNDAHIIIHPTCDKLYRVVVHKKKAEVTLGPLTNDTVVTAEALGSLVRLTATTADRSATAQRRKMPVELFEQFLTPLVS